MASQNDDDEPGYTPPVAEDELLYEQTMRRLRLEIDKGRTYDQACRAISGLEQELTHEIGEDFLRIIIAERHFGEGYGIDDLALLLDVEFEKIEAIRDYMLRDIGNSLTREKRRLISTSTH
jgi:hypothetical protein